MENIADPDQMEAGWSGSKEDTSGFSRPSVNVSESYDTFEMWFAR